LTPAPRPDRAPDMRAPAAAMAQATIDDEMMARMREKVGADLRIDHSVNNDYASRVAVAKFAGGVGDINPLWIDETHGERSSYGAPVAPPSFVIGCFSGIQFGWPGLGSFHSRSEVTFHKPVYWHDGVFASCVYEGFDGPAPSSFAGRTVTDRFVNRYRNQHGELIATIRWQVINFERGSAARRADGNGSSGLTLPQRWDEDELQEIEASILAERPRGTTPRFWEDVRTGDTLESMTKGPIGLTDEIAFVAGGGTPIPRVKAHAAALHDYRSHPAWAFRDPVTSAWEPIYSVHYNEHAANAMSVPAPYDVGFQRQCWQVHHLTHWCGDDGWIKRCHAEYRKFVFLSDVVELTGEVVDKRVDDDGEHVVEVATTALNQRGENVMPGRAVVALPLRAGGSPVERRSRRGDADA
jgi:acyl dehydratase